MKHFPKSLFAAFALLFCVTVPVAAMERWTGVASAKGETTRVVLSIRDNGGERQGFLDLPDIGVVDWPTSSIRATAAGLEFSIPSDAGGSSMLLVREAKTLSGLWIDKDWPVPATVRLALDGQQRIASETFEEKEITVSNKGVLLGGTIVHPKGTGPFPLLVFVHGSGAQTRHASTFPAREMAKQGIASLRFDMRGTGTSSGDWLHADFDDLASDVCAVADAARQLPVINRNQVGLHGTSQGAWVAPLAATRCPMSFVIVVSGTVESPSRETRWDALRLLRAAGYGGDVETKANQLMDDWDEGVRRSDFQKFEEHRAPLVGQPWFATTFPYDKTPYHSRYKKEDLSWFRRIIDHNARDILGKIDIPVLYLLAKEDESIDAMATAHILRHDFKNRVRYHVYKGYSHSMRRTVVNGFAPRWPASPSDFYVRQTRFILDSVKARL
jgi:alpha-beta hydrolase superfamily lysophospholipase